MGQTGAEDGGDTGATVSDEFRDRLAAIVTREVQAAHGDILRELAEIAAENDRLKDQVRRLEERIRDARADLNTLRGARSMAGRQYDANGVEVVG